MITHPELDEAEAALLGFYCSHLPQTAAEEMMGEMPCGWVGGKNHAPGPTYSEVWWRERDEAMDDLAELCHP